MRIRMMAVLLQYFQTILLRRRQFTAGEQTLRLSM